MNQSQTTVYVLLAFSLLATTICDEQLSVEEDKNLSRSAVVKTPKWLKHYWLIVQSLLAFQCSVLYHLGQPIISKTGGIRLWTGNTYDRENSQHITDWYTLTHIIHGIGFYWVLGKILPKHPIPLRSLLALALEVLWEVAENSPIIIDRYRRTALALGYTGDSVINSFSDTVAMTLGFYLTKTLPIPVIVAFAVAIELFCAYKIRDNLTLNMIQLIHPIDAISRWQSNLKDSTKNNQQIHTP